MDFWDRMRPLHELQCFDDFSLDLTRGSLQHGQEEVRLRPKSFEVLKYLVVNEGRLVSKDELIHAVWSNTAVTDDSVVQCLKEIRNALQDYDRQLIKTVHGRGYIFDCKVRFRNLEQTRDIESSTSPLIENQLSTKSDLDADHIALMGASSSVSIERVVARKSMTRLMVLPFRMLRADPEFDFLAFSVPDAVAGAISVLDSVVVCSPTSAARYASDVINLQRIAEEAKADAVITGTVLTAGTEIRVTCQLLEVPSGTVLWWLEPQVAMSGLLELHDNLVRGIVDSLSLSLNAREHSKLMRDIPSRWEAFELYLRANELSRRGLAGFADLSRSREAYLRAVEIDPQYAPAWAQLGRCYRLIGKGMENGSENFALAESAFQRALELNHDLPLVHSQYAYLEAELGRAEQAMTRLLSCALTHTTSPEIFAALVLCCRFCGLLKPSVAAHNRARNLDPRIATSVSHTHYQLGDFENAVREVAVGAWGIMGMALGTMGKCEDAIETFLRLEESSIPAPMRAFICAWRAMFEGNRAESLAAAERCIQQYLDPEGVFYMGLIIARLGETDRALTVLQEAVDRGFSSVDVLQRNPWFDELRSTNRFAKLMRQGETHLLSAREAYQLAKGTEVLGV